ncbi:MAG: thiamine pyrophosphate-dependent enzyme [Bacteroidales bacterium]|nr:thiamine pyrophosphate-dependent enzyme [Bacteroidales bacterium]
MGNVKTKAPHISLSKEDILSDYRIACESRQASLLGRREVLSGKAKFGIFGDGKEVPQLAMARAFKEGDWRSGYYRDQTFMLAAGMMKLEEFFAQLYGDTHPDANPGTGGRMMNNHFATQSLDEKGDWKDLTAQKNSSADISPTAGQMPRLVGLALASKHYRNNPALKEFSKFSVKGNEVAFGTIGDASTSEGIFWESINAAGVMQVPMALSVWDDGWGISVPREYQTTKNSISEILKGFEETKKARGFRIYKLKGWDYPALINAYDEGIAYCREKHVPVIFHVDELTQPQGHSTSGSHERYKSPERLEWEKAHDGITKMREWMIGEEIATAEELEKIEKEAAKRAKEAKKNAWAHFQKPLSEKRDDFLRMVDISTCNCAKTSKINAIKEELSMVGEPIWKDIMSSGKKILRLICDSCSNPQNSLKENVMAWRDKVSRENENAYNDHLWSESDQAAIKVKAVAPEYADDAPKIPGREIIQKNFNHIFEHNPLVCAFGEDVGRIGGVNQTMEGLQKKYGELRVFDTGIREATILGQGLGMAMRGLRPLAEIQYFDYLLYGLQVLSDDLATVRYRTKGQQKAPMIISTRGHRLEGIWHSGSPLSMVINSIRGVHVLVPRNLTQAAGFYNTMLESDEPALIIEPLNAYRLREKLPSNLGKFKVAVGRPEILKSGADITLVTYGSCVRIAEDAVKQLKDFDIDVELIDVQSLLPFDVNHTILDSIKKTNKVLFFDEDVPGGATAYMMQKVLEEQKAFFYLDAGPATLTAHAHRAAYSTDGDYFSNPNAEDVFDSVYNIMHDVNPAKYPKIF